VSSSQADLQLMRRISQRDRDAAETLFERHADELHRFLLRRLSSSEAEDALQEVLKRALVSASTYRGDGSLRAWLYAIARHALMERRRDRIAPGSWVEPTDEGPGPESLVLGAEAQRSLLAALERLPDEQAIVLELHRVDGLGHREIATVLGIRAATSRKRLERALVSIRRTLTGGPARLPIHERFESWRRSLRMRALPGDSVS